MSTPVLRIHRAHRMHSVDAAYCYNGVAWSACLSVCVLGTPVNPAKTDEPPIDIYRLICRLMRAQETRRGAHWRQLANTTERSTGGADAALCQITMTTRYYEYYITAISTS